MSALTDLLSLRKRRLDLQREADLLEQQEKALKTQLINEMIASGADSFQDGEDIAYLKQSIEPQVDSWSSLLTYIHETGQLDLLQKRVTASAIKARWADGVDIPGVNPVTKRDLTFNV